jgi:hypothetical protein
MSEIEELSARVAKLEAWVEAVMRTLAGMQVEPVLIELDEARRAYDEEDESCAPPPTAPSARNAR